MHELYKYLVEQHRAELHSNLQIPMSWGLSQSMSSKRMKFGIKNYTGVQVIVRTSKLPVSRYLTVIYK
jgi:hypothetical protein